jgi:hypothetical protein
MDFGFTKIFTPGIVKFTYFMSVPGLLLAWAVLTGVGFHYGTWWGLGALVVVGPGLFIGGLLTLRVVFELILVGLRAADDLHALRASGIEAGGSRPTPRPRPAGA